MGSRDTEGWASPYIYSPFEKLPGHATLLDSSSFL